MGDKDPCESALDRGLEVFGEAATAPSPLGAHAAGSVGGFDGSSSALQEVASKSAPGKIGLPKDRA